MIKNRQILNRAVSKIEEVTESLIPDHECFQVGCPPLRRTDTDFLVVIDAFA